MTRQEMLAQAMEMSGESVARYFKGFDDSNLTRQAEHLPNHFAWTLGHMALHLHRAAGAFDGGPLPAEQWASADGRGGDARRYDTEGVAFGSTPFADAALYPSAARCVEIFRAGIARLAAALRGASDAKLDEVVQWGPWRIAAWTLGPRMLVHNGTHCGQLADLRRALGMGSIFG